jgi:hypothetical protein
VSYSYALQILMVLRSDVALKGNEAKKAAGVTQGWVSKDEVRTAGVTGIRWREFHSNS